MYRVKGTRVSIEKASTVTTGKRGIGQLMHLDVNGKASTVTSYAHYPLVEPFDGAVDHAAGVQVDSVAKVYVETASGIVAGSPLKAGATGLGAALAEAGDNYFGHALVQPRGDGDYIPVVLSKGYEADPAY